MMDVMLFLSSLTAIVGVAVLAYGYRASLWSDDRATRFFAWSMALLAGSVFWRRLWWDILHPVVTGTIDQRPLNVIINIVTIGAVYFGLRARLLLIPAEERAAWRWWNCWQHPSIWRLRTDRPIGPHEGR